MSHGRFKIRVRSNERRAVHRRTSLCLGDRRKIGAKRCISGIVISFDVLFEILLLHVRILEHLTQLHQTHHLLLENLFDIESERLHHLVIPIILHVPGILIHILIQVIVTSDLHRVDFNLGISEATQNDRTLSRTYTEDSLYLFACHFPIY